MIQKMNPLNHNPSFQKSDSNFLLDLEDQLQALDFSKESDSQRIFEKTKIRLAQSQRPSVFKSHYLKVAASFLILGVLFSQNTYAKEMFDKIIRSVMLTDATVVQIEKQVPSSEALSSGSASDALQEKDSAIGDDDIVIEKDKSKLEGMTSFKLRLPAYLPSGYAFNRAEFFKSEDGTLSAQYINLYFSNPHTKKEIYLQAREASDDTGYVAITDGSTEKVQVAGAVAALIDGKSLQWSAHGVLYNLSCKGDLGRDTLIQIAESIQ